MKNWVNLSDLKSGDRFYNSDDEVLVLISDVACDKQQIKFYARKLGSNIPMHYSISYGDGECNYKAFLYKGRHESSFYAGFRAAMRLCAEHMGIFDLENSGLDNPINQHLTMQEEYKKRKQN